MSSYPGRSSRRLPYAVAILAVLAAFAVGWFVAPRSASHAAASSTTCPGGRDDAGRHRAAACLVGTYFSLENESAAQRNAVLKQLVLPGSLAPAQASYVALRPGVAAEYAAVAATNVQASPTQPDTDATGQAWVAFVDSYRDGSRPAAQWWITTFELRWSSGRWWLTGGVAPEVNATPQTAASAPRDGFGPGWVAVGRA